MRRSPFIFCWLRLYEPSVRTSRISTCSPLFIFASSASAAMRDAGRRGPQIFAETPGSAGSRLHLLELDVEQPEEWANAARYIEERLGARLDVLVNNAGYGLVGALEDQTMEQLRKQFEVN